MTDYEVKEIINQIPRYCGDYDKQMVDMDQLNFVLYRICDKINYEMNNQVGGRLGWEINQLKEKFESENCMLREKNEDLTKELKILKMFLNMKNICTEEEYHDFKDSLLLCDKLTQDGKKQCKK